MTGHQPELFHPGVWIKNFAAGAIAGAHGGIGLNLIVDNDIPKSSSIQVPKVDGDVIRLARVEFDRWGGEVPFEDLAVREEGLFSYVCRPSAAESPAMPSPAPCSTTSGRASSADGARPAPPACGFRWRGASSRLRWGVSNLEVPLSAVCRDRRVPLVRIPPPRPAPVYQQIHNDALDDYRAAHRIRSRNHPVAALERQGRMARGPVLGLAQGTAPAPRIIGPPAVAGDGSSDRRRG